MEKGSIFHVKIHRHFNITGQDLFSHENLKKKCHNFTVCCSCALSEAKSMAAVKNTPWCDSQWHLYFINGASTGKAHQIFISISRSQNSILFSYYILVIFKLFQMLTLKLLDIFKHNTPPKLFLYNWLIGFQLLI